MDSTGAAAIAKFFGMPPWAVLLIFTVLATLASAVGNLLADVWKNRQTELLRYRLSFEDRRKTMTGKLGNFIHFYLFEFDGSEESRSEWAKRYWDLIPWLSRDMVVALSDCVADNGRFKKDVRYLLELARREINDTEEKKGDAREFANNMIKAEVLAPQRPAPTPGSPPAPQMKSTP